MAENPQTTVAGVVPLTERRPPEIRDLADQPEGTVLGAVDESLALDSSSEDRAVVAPKLSGHRGQLAQNFVDGTLDLDARMVGDVSHEALGRGGPKAGPETLVIRKVGHLVTPPGKENNFVRDFVGRSP